LDFSPAMLAQAARRAGRVPATVLLVLGDAERLPFADGTFDAALLDLVLSVVHDGAACWREAARAVRSGGRIVIFDKFAPEGRAPSRERRLLNLLTRAGGTDITRRLGDLTAGTAFTLERAEPSILRGAYRLLRVRLP
jgi:ubiquinone/menaquinone biosynthesis C-methylase UbiE